jgi:predicted CxxxxCH...CXXCH cytochrome family protein
MNTSAHPSHVSAATVMPVQNCQLCHYATVNTTNDQVVNDKTKHVNGARDVAIEPSYDSNGATSNWDGTSCTAVYCHSNGKATPTFQTINWSTTIGCTGCHGGAGTATTLSTAHLAHVGTDPSDTNKQFGYTCDVCHVQTASSNSAIGTVANHINKLRDVSVVAAKGGTGTIVGGDYGEDILTPRPDSCGTTNCHGTSSPGWVAGATNGDCSACHGMSDPLKTSRDTNGDTTDSDFQVGAHAAHMNSLNNYSADIACDQCHNATYAEMAVQTTYVGKVNVAGHIDSVLPAEVTYGSIAAAAGAPTSYVPGTGVCSNYCHGSSLANGYDINPGWDQNAYLTGTFSATGDCNRCHGCPPLITGHTGSETLDKCGQCHTATMTNGVGNAFLDVTKHVNGVVEVNTSCVTCHGQLPPNTGSHPKHGVHLVQDLLYSNGNPDGTLADWNATNYPACAVCHDMTDQAFHTPPGDPTIMGAAKPDEAFAPNYPVPGAGYPVYDKVNQTCTNARCHFKPTPDWKP